MIILDDTDLIIDSWLGVEDIGQRPHYEHRRSFYRMLEPQVRELDGRKLASDILAKMEANWSRSRQQALHRLPSDENWRFEKRSDFDGNGGNETFLERAIARLTDETWANQIPITSGLGDFEGRRCCIDLARLLLAELWLYELKWPSNPPSDTPLSAAIQMLRYGLIYLFWRKRRDELTTKWPEESRRREMLDAGVVHLRVLAPSAFYGTNRAGSLGWLETVISDGLAAIARGERIVMDFRFEVFKEPLFEALYR